MKTVNVVAAIICDNYNKKTKIFATQRGYGEYKDGWEFPGGKIEEGETPEQALVCEIREELGAKIRVHDLIDVIDYDYETFVLDHSDKISEFEKTAEGEYKVKAESAEGIQYTYRSAEGDADILEYYETWSEEDFSEMYRGGASLSRVK